MIRLIQVNQSGINEGYRPDIH